MAGINYLRVPAQLEWGDDVFPPIVVNNGSVNSIEEAETFVKTHKTELEEKLNKNGALLFRGFPINSAETFDAFSASFDYPNFTYQESLSNAVRINFTERVFTANEAPKEVEIFLHHEMAQTPISPSKLFFFCQRAADVGGATPLCRSDKLYEALQKEDADLAAQFAKKGVKYTSTMPSSNDADSGQGRSWKDTLSVQTQSEAASKLAQLGYIWEWLADSSLRATTPTLPAVIQRNDGSYVFFNQLIAAYMGWQGVRENPSSAITFGDGSQIPREVLDLIVELSKSFTFDVDWQDNDVAIVDNYRTMHGRRAYSGTRKRQVLVAMAADG